MEKISLSVLVLWVAIGVSLSAIYVPILSDSQELLINTLNSGTGNIMGNDLNFSLPLVSLIQGELNKDYFEISPSTNSGKNTVTIPTINLPATIVPTTPAPTTPSTGTNTDTTPDTDTDATPPDTGKDTIKEPDHNISDYILDYHHKYHRHYHQLHHPKKNSKEGKN